MQVWGKWTTGLTADIVDPSLGGQYPEDEILSCVEVGLLCVQENPVDRPDASTVALMLSSPSSTTDDRRRAPSRPAFVFGSASGLNSTAASGHSLMITGDHRYPSTAPVSENEVSISELLPR